MLPKKLTFKIIGRRSIQIAGLLIIVAVLAVLSIQALAATDSTEVGGEISSNTVWRLSGSPYIVTSNVKLVSGKTLTIEPGVEVRFDPGKRLRIAGLLIAQGNASNPITFTSNLSNPSPGDWSNIVFVNAGLTVINEVGQETALQNILQHCVIEFAGAGNEGAIRSEASSLLIDNCSIRNNSDGGIRILNTGGNAVTISNNTIEHNNYIGNGGGVLAKDSSILGNIVRYNHTSDSGGGIHSVRGTVRDNFVVGNSAGREGGGIFAEDSFVSGNFVSENSADRGGGVLAEDSDFSFNTLVKNRSDDRGGGVYFIGSSIFQQNTVIANSSPAGFAFGGVEISGSPTVNFNNIYANQPFDLVLDSSGDINAKNNFWASTNSGTILGLIFDKFDDPDRGLVTFEPFLSDATEPVPPPLNLQGTLTNGDMDLSLTWDPIPATSATYTYQINYSNTPGPPFEGTGLSAGNSPVDVGSVTSFTLTGINTAPYYVSVTAKDVDDNVSWYSNQVNNFKKSFLPFINVEYQESP